MPAPRRLPLTEWEKNLVTRLLTPTFSYLARSKSAGCQSGVEGTLSHGNRMSPLALEWSLCSGWFVASTAFNYSALWLLMLLIFSSITVSTIFPYQNSHVAQITGLVVPVCRRAASFHSTTDTTILQKPPYSTGSAHKRPSASLSPISIHSKPPSSSSPICSQPKIAPASLSAINSQHRKATVSSSPNRSTTPAQVICIFWEEKLLFVRFFGLKDVCK